MDFLCSDPVKTVFYYIGTVFNLILQSTGVRLKVAKILTLACQN